MTKYAVQINEPNEIKYHLDKACKLATTGRPGPVWLDIPLNVQSADINPDELIGYEDEDEVIQYDEEDIITLKEKWEKAKKPLMIVGNGVRFSDAVDELKKLLQLTNIPVISSVNGNDIINSDYEYYYGRFGTHAQICANNLLNECDLLITIGSRLYVRQTGYNFKGFAEQAYKIHIDIDKAELDKPTLYTDLKIHSDAKIFLSKMLTLGLPKVNKNWINICNEYNKSPKVLDKHRNNKKFVSHYYFVEELSKIIPNDYNIVTSNGSANVVTMQVMDLKNEQRLITNTGCAPMGYGLPAAIGASINHKIICIEGDGSLHLNIHELQTMKHYNLPIKLILLNNDGYLSIKVSQKTFFNSRYVASEKNSGVSFPNFKKLIKAYDIPYYSIKTNKNIHPTLETFIKHDGPCICEVFTDPEEFHEPKVMAILGTDGKFIPGNLKDIQWIKK